MPSISGRQCEALSRKLHSTKKRHYKENQGPFIWADAKAPCYISLYGVELNDEGDFSDSQISWRASWIQAECDRKGTRGGSAAINMENLWRWYVSISGDEPVGPPRPPIVSISGNETLGPGVISEETS